MGEVGEISKEVYERVKKWAATTEDPVESEKNEISRLQRHTATGNTPYNPAPGRQRHYTGRVGVPQLRETGIGLLGPRDLRDKVDPKDPETQPGPLKIRKLPQK